MGDEMAMGPPVERLDAECSDAEVTVKGRVFKVRLVERAFAIPAARADPFAAWDTETTLIKYDGSQLEGVTLQVCYLSSRLVHIVPWYAWAAYKLAFAAARPCSEIVMHNAAFDLKVLGFTDDLWLWGEFMDGRVVDTMVRTLHKSQGHGRYMPQLSLKACAKAILRMDLEKDESVRLTHTRDMRYTRQHLEYGAKDAIVTAMIRSALGEPFEENDPGAELLALKGAVALEAVRDNGMLVDSDEYCRMRRMLAENVEHHAEFLREWGVVPGEEGNKAALQRILAKFERKYGFALPRTEKSGDIQLTDLAMADIPEDRRHPFMNSWTCYVGVRQILKHFFRDDLEGRGVKVDGGEDADDEGDDSERRVHQDGKIHPRYSWATDTGRTQCSRPNAQNFPRKAEIWLDAMNEKPDITLSVRGYIVPAPGHCLNSIDFNQLELCGLAEDCMVRFGHSVMAELINAGEDLHTWFAEQITIARRMYWGALGKKERKNLRALGKVTNFGFPGGLSAESLVDFALKGYGVRLTVQEASELKKIWMAAFPEMQEFFKMQPDERETAYCVRRKAEELGLDIGDSPTKQALEEAMRVKLQGQVRALRAAGRFAEADEEERRIRDAARGMTMGVERYICKTFTGRVLKNKTYNACANASFQAPCSDVAMKAALFGQWLRGYRPVNAIHDEVINELELTANLSDVAMEQAAAWVDDAQALFKHVRLKAEPALMLRWDKGAEACFDGEGRLQIWTPDIAVDEKKIEAIAETAWEREWRELFNSKGSRYGFQPLSTAEKIMSMCNNQN